MSEGQPPAPTHPRRADLTDLDTLFTQRLVRWRWLYFALLALLVVAPFNGEWRLGLDSSLYLGVAENLAAGNGYTFAGMRQTQVYPGLPYVLAGLDKLFGTDSVVPALVVMNACALLTLWVIYRLIGSRYPTWVAIVVTCGVAMNLKFVQQAQEIMTDMPHLLGVVTALLGWERLRDARSRTGLLGATLVLGAGLFLAAVMRPTFWVLALALVLTCLWNLVRHREGRSLMVLGVLAGVVACFVAFDPRVRGIGLLHGGYEREFMTLIDHVSDRIRANAPHLFGKEITETFFNEPMAMFAIPLAILLLLGAAMVTWRQPLWGLQVFILTGVMLVLSDVPRYYLLVLPTLWLGYLLAILWLTRWIGAYARDWTMFFLISFANFPNLGGVAALVYEQHRPGPFVENYRDGSYVRFVEMAKLVRQHVPEDARVVGPYANLLTYLSGRTVLSGRLMGFETAGLTKYPALVARFEPQYMIGPVIDYREKDPALARLLEHGVVVPTGFVAATEDQRGSLWLARAKVVVPVADWRKTPTTRPTVYVERRRPTTQRHGGFSAEELAHRELKAKRERKELRAKRERKAIRAARERKAIRAEREAARQATTQPATKPATRPTTRPAEVVAPLEQLGALCWPAR